MVTRAMISGRPGWIGTAVCQGTEIFHRIGDQDEKAALLASLRHISAAVCAAMVIAGCAAAVPPPPVVRTVTVQVPVVRQVPCPAPTLGDPALPISRLKPNSPPSDTMRAYAASVAILKGAVRERDSVLAGCAHPDRATEADRAEADKPR
jgi:hypothetical protein